LQNILFFSNNNGKVKEIKNLFHKYPVQIVTPKKLGILKEPRETGNTFEKNAKIKSKYGYSISKIPCFADDSGICIEALNWKPKVYSRRFLEKFYNNDKCFEYIIKKIKQTEKVRAYFQTSISLTLDYNHHIVFNGQIHGIISYKAIGNKGFGYDPIFIPNNSKKTFGELNRKEKNLVSHRSIAVKKLISFLFN
tara:strand:- start:585 stop:1166 length:582 start_codon:yes stop_codon:yes gene_type:complete